MKLEYNLIKIFKITNKYCKTECYSCCCHEGCLTTLKDNYFEGIDYTNQFDENKEIPFLSETGCIIPIENRIFCSTFICNKCYKKMIKEDKQEYDKLMKKLV